MPLSSSSAQMALSTSDCVADRGDDDDYVALITSVFFPCRSRSRSLPSRWRRAPCRSALLSSFSASRLVSSPLPFWSVSQLRCGRRRRGCQQIRCDSVRASDRVDRCNAIENGYSTRGIIGPSSPRLSVGAGHAGHEDHDELGADQEGPRGCDGDHR